MRAGAAIPMNLGRPASRSVSSAFDLPSLIRAARPVAAATAAWARPSSVPPTSPSRSWPTQGWALSSEANVLLSSPDAASPEAASPILLEEATVDDEDGSTSSVSGGLAMVLDRLAGESAMELESVVRKRKRKMNHHRYRKRRRLQRFLRRKHEN